MMRGSYLVTRINQNHHKGLSSPLKKILKQATQSGQQAATGPVKLSLDIKLQKKSARALRPGLLWLLLFVWELQGTVFTAGSLQGPGWLSAPMARTRVQMRLPDVKPFMVHLDLLLTVLKAHVV